MKNSDGKIETQNVDETFPVVFNLTLECSHTQLVSRPLPVGTLYPCWVACDSTRPVAQTVIDVTEVNLEESHTGVVVASGLSNEEMRRVSQIAHEFNNAAG